MCIYMVHFFPYENSPEERDEHILELKLISIITGEKKNI